MKKLLVYTAITMSLLFGKRVSAQTEVIFYTTMGVFEVELYDTLQPITAGNFISLVVEKFYDEIIFHRVVEGFVIQGGDPMGTGFGGPGYTIDDEFDPLASNVQKALGMANAGPNTGGSQFYINMVDNTYLDPNYPVFGIVIDHFDVVEAISHVEVNGLDKPLVPVVMDSVRIKQTWPTGINTNVPVLDISVSPNPATDIIQINASEVCENCNLSLINNTGQLFWEDSFSGDTQIPAADLPTGLYFIIVSNEHQQYLAVKRVAIEH